MKINLFRITAHEGEIASGSTAAAATASSEPVLNLSSASNVTTTEAQVEVNSLKCDEYEF